MAAALGMTWRNLRYTIDADPELPILTRGGEGIAYRFRAAAVFKHLIAKCNDAIAQRDERALRMARITGIRLPAPVAGVHVSSETLTASELKIAGETLLVVHKLKLLQGAYVEAPRLTAFLIDYHSQFQQRALSLLGKIDPAGQWPVAVRQAVDDTMRTLLVNLQADMERFLSGIRDTPAR